MLAYFPQQRSNLYYLTAHDRWSDDYIHVTTVWVQIQILQEVHNVDEK